MRHGKVLKDDRNRSAAQAAGASTQIKDKRAVHITQQKLMQRMGSAQREEKGEREVAMDELPEEQAKAYMISAFKKGKFTPPKLDENGKIVQRVTRGTHDGGEYFAITRNDLNKGTDTSQGTRDYVNNPSTPKPSFVEFNYLIGSSSFSSPISQVYYADNPKSSQSYSSGSFYDAGHKLASQNGGKGDQNSWVFPQNPAFNQGNSRLMSKTEKKATGKTYPVWRAHEQHFHNEVNRNGVGVWWVAFG